MATRLGLALLLAGAALANAAPALSSSGVSIDVASIDVSEELQPGTEYRLPTFGVRNPGTQSTTYRLVVNHSDGFAGALAPTSWFTFTPDRLTLAAGVAAPITTQLRSPPDAEPGRYEALIGPEIVPGGDGPTVGAGAAARLTFVVRPSSDFDAWVRWLLGQLAERPWLLAIAGTALLLLALRLIRRRFTIRIERRG